MAMDELDCYNLGWSGVVVSLVNKRDVRTGLAATEGGPVEEADWGR